MQFLSWRRGARRWPFCFDFKDEWQKVWEEKPEEFKELAIEWLKDDKLRGLIIQLIDGKPAQDLNVGGQPQNPIQVIINLPHEDNEPIPETGESSTV